MNEDITSVSEGKFGYQLTNAEATIHSPVKGFGVTCGPQKHKITQHVMLKSALHII